uniref:Glycylpeptide N-tetradecanoyltransferase n=1 Tax=viral metagenome TaxID=1070528 RepID=A0A6C0ARI5_9ZZZZ
MILYYIAITLFLTCIALFIYIKIRFPFWNIQPVFHTYDYWRYFYKEPFIVYKFRPVKTKFCDFIQVQTRTFLECSATEIADIVDLLQCYYLPSDRILHTITKEDIETYMTGHLSSTYVSLYTETHFTRIDASNNDTSIIRSEKPTACLTSRPLKIWHRPTLREPTYKELPIYFIDFLAVNRDKDVKTVSRKLLQTHEYYQRKQNPDIVVSLIKKEIDLFDGVVPLILYKTDTYYLRNIHFPSLPPHHQITRVYKENLEILTDFIYLLTSVDNGAMFDICIMPDIGSILAQIKQSLLYVYALRRGEHTYAMYFFKDMKTQYEDIDGNTLQCYASVMNMKDEALFYLGYLHSIQNIIKQNKTYKMLFMENMGHNTVLSKLWKQKHTAIFSNNSAYYLYNMVFPCSPVSEQRCMVLS